MQHGLLNFAVTFTTRNILRRESSLAKVVGTLSCLNRLSALEQCVAWSRDDFLVRNANLTWQKDKDRFQHLVDGVVPSHLHGACWQVFDESGFIGPFTEVGLLSLIGMVCRFSKDSGGDPVLDQPTRWKLFCPLLHLQTEQVPTALSKKDLRAQFPLIMRTVLATLSTQNRWGYDLGRLHALATVPEIGRYLRVSYGGMTVADWFQKRLGISAAYYEAMVNVQHGAAVCGADFAELPSKQPQLAPAILRLCELAAQTPEELARQVSPLTSLWQAATFADHLMVRPLLRVGSKYLLTSIGHLFSKFHRGLPYLVVESGKSMGCTEVKRLRGEFGWIFQGYVFWLMERWFGGSDTQVITNYWVEGCGLCGESGEPCEKDLLILREGKGYIFEVKGSTLLLAARQRCQIDDFKSWLAPITKQAYHAAQGLVQGRAFLDKEKRQPIVAPKRVYPCGVIFDFNPLRFPYSDFFQQALEFDLPVSVFHDFPQIAPMQYFDIQQVEMWDDLVALPAKAGELFDAIQRRAEQRELRYSWPPGQLDFRPDYAERPSLVRSLADHGEIESSKRLKELEAKQA